jgi:hypothetical protein
MSKVEPSLCEYCGNDHSNSLSCQANVDKLIGVDISHHEKHPFVVRAEQAENERDQYFKELHKAIIVLKTHNLMDEYRNLP